MPARGRKNGGPIVPLQALTRTCYRYEQSGELSGLLRVRCLTMNDAHIYVKEDQIEQEIKSVLSMYQSFYDTFRLKEYTFRLSIRGAGNESKFKGDPIIWEKAEKILEKVLVEMKLPFYMGEGEAAFYGPKIDIQFKNLMGREETVSTIQVDFLSPENFNLRYIDEHSEEKRPVIIHRAPLSTHERFISFLIEYYGGAFPTWCAPVQLAIIPVNDTCNAYCDEIRKQLFEHRFRVDIDFSNNSFNKKIRTNTINKIPNMLIIGNKEVEEQTITLRRYGQEEQETLPLSVFITSLKKEVAERTILREPMGSII